MKLLTFGTFDLFHRGHLHFLNECIKLADEVVVAVNTDEFVKKFKGKEPIVSYKERVAMLKELDFQVVKNKGGADSKPTILAEKPDILAIGSDWARKDYYKQMGFTQDWLDKQGIILCYIPYTKGVSSTEVRKKL